ncbi:hypothetical protein ACOMHN_038123 [Nucella lapillus]
MATVGAGEAGGRVMVHWTHSGPSVQTLLADRGGHHSSDEDDDGDDEDDELLAQTPPRERLSYTRYQLELLNGIFRAVRYPNSVQKQLIAKRVGISREQVKIWFQNRRRKDVVMCKTGPSGSGDTDSSKGSPQESTSSSTSPPPGGGPSEGKSSGDPGGDVSSEDQKDGKPRMVPEAVVQGCITELRRFSDEKLKERKEKRKAKGKRRSHSAATSSATAQAVTLNPNQSASRLFQAYDMVAPPNKVTPTAAFLDTSTNRFHHCLNSSAFSSPRYHMVAASTAPRLAWDGALDPGGLGGLGTGLGSFGAGGLGGLGVMGSSQTGGVGVGVGMGPPHDCLPVLSDLLSYRQHADTGSSAGQDSREASLPQASLPQASLPQASLAQASLLASSSPRDREASKLLELGSLPAPPSPFSMNRVYPFPFIADPPIMLSSLHHQHDPLHPWPHPPPHPVPAPPPPPFPPMAAVNGMDPYKMARISSLGNPYFSTPAPPPPPSHWSPQSAPDPSQGPSFTQL